MANGGWYEYSVTQFGYVNWGGNWHQGNGNYHWADGHATLMQPSQLTLQNFVR
jgi:prepilin-type processing-associated H-X9-DG protein